MSRENVEQVRASFTAFNRGDFQAAAACVHPEAELHAHLGAVEWKTYRGPGALVRMWSDFEEAFGGTLQVEVKELLIECEDQVVAVVEALATGRKSGVEVRRSWAQLTTHRNGFIIRIEPFPDRDAAVEAAGLSE